MTTQTNESSEKESPGLWPDSITQVFAVMGMTMAVLVGVTYPLVDDRPLDYHYIGLGIAVFLVAVIMHVAPRVWRRVVSR